MFLLCSPTLKLLVLWLESGFENVMCMAPHQGDSSLERLESFIKCALGPTRGGWERKNLFISSCLPLVKSYHVNIALPPPDFWFLYAWAPRGCLAEPEVSENRGREQHGWAWSWPMWHSFEAGPSNVWGLRGFDSQARDSVTAWVIHTIRINSISWEPSSDYRYLENPRSRPFCFYFLWILSLKKKKKVYIH